MSKPWLSLILAAGLSATMASGVASAQNVYVRGTAGAVVELVLNENPAVTATADSMGTAAFTVPLVSPSDPPQVDGRVVVDGCGNRRRVMILESGRQAPAADAGCHRAAVGELFVFRSSTRLVITADGDRATVLIRQGSVPLEWLGLGDANKADADKPSGRGLVLGGGGALANFSDAVGVMCGDAPVCTGKSTKAAYTFGGSLWITKFLAIDVGYLKPRIVTATGSGTSYRFDGQLDARVLTVGGKLGVRAGPFMFYALGGTNYTRAASTAVNAFDASSKTTAGEETIAFKTTGWGWSAGGGIEWWVRQHLGVFVEGRNEKIKGSNTTGEEGALDDTARVLVVGGRLRFGNF